MAGPRVLSHPVSGPYVDRLNGRVGLLLDGARPTELAWVRSHAGEWDLTHLHLGLEAGPVDWVPGVVAAMREAGTPIVITVHQLQSGHLPATSTDIVEVLRATASSASSLLTLTPGCAEAIESLTGRHARVIPHGPIVPDPRRRRMRAHRRRAIAPPAHVLVHIPALTPNLGLEELAAACRLTRPLLDIRIQVDPGDAAAVQRIVGDVEGIEVVAHPPTGAPSVDVRTLERSVADAAALLVPYRWGTHCDLIEVAADVGTPVITTTAGNLIEQVSGTALGGARPRPGSDGHDPHVKVWNGRLDVPDLARILSRPIGDVPVVSECDRERTEHAFISHHERLYHRLGMGVIDLRT